MQFVSSGDNLHEMSNPLSVKNKKNISLSSAEFACRVVKIVGKKVVKYSWVLIAKEFGESDLHHHDCSVPNILQYFPIMCLSQLFFNYYFSEKIRLSISLNHLLGRQFI